MTCTTYRAAFLLIILLFFPLAAEKRKARPPMQEFTNPKSPSFVPFPYPKNRKEINGDTAERTVFHCEAFKLEILASAKLQAKRLGDLITSKTEKITMEEALIAKQRIKAILELTEEGL